MLAALELLFTAPIGHSPDVARGTAAGGPTRDVGYGHEEYSFDEAQGLHVWPCVRCS